MRLINALEELRRYLGPLHVLSGYRCQEHNKRVGGEPKSLHALGRAADIVSANFHVKKLYEIAQRVPAFRDSGIGFYPDEGFVHVDVGRAKPARWGRIKGRGYVSVEEAINYFQEKRYRGTSS